MAMTFETTIEIAAILTAVLLTVHLVFLRGEEADAGFSFYLKRSAQPYGLQPHDDDARSTDEDVRRTFFLIRWG